jgi:hypothetical protein
MIVYKISADDLSGGTGSLTGSFIIDGINPVVTITNTLS